MTASRTEISKSQPSHDAPPTREVVSPPLLDLVDVEKTYATLDGERIIALSPTDLQVKAGEFICIVGPSGCGKTTLLNLISGLIRPSGGEIRFRGVPTEGPSAEIGIVFQKPVLLAWRSVIENVMLPIEVMNLRPRQQFQEKARQLLATVGLAGFENRYPRELSGGMQQRAAIARTLVYDSSLLLMDEPFAALDAMTREELNLELMRIWKLTGRTILFVTHNIPEAVLLSDRVVVMTPRPGKIKAVVAVPLERPRTLELMGTARFGDIANNIRSLLYGTEQTQGQGA
ncbi:MAG: NitT/TauT family transport system ATP-binding protein [Bradyrhizobium sp.]|jgi:NitT/TauT family transport system ATP-binding protein|nr:NitT/TauT family transport system ATP-binding protein [Bradyrhizobium sp.]